MSTKTLRVGIIGADTKASWAGVSHVHALKNLPGLSLRAVATFGEDEARAAAKAFGAEHWFTDGLALAASPDVDIVSVCIKVPAHQQMVLAALGAGKAVYCESPLGSNIVEADAMVAAASAAKAHTAIGLQARLNPSARRAAQLIKEGAIGRPLTARVVSTSAGFGPESVGPYAYFDKAISGANLTTITAAHTLDIIEAILGPIQEVEGRAAILFPMVNMLDSGTQSPREVPDYVHVLGQTELGCQFSADINGGIAPEKAFFTFEIRGTTGSLSLIGGHPYGFQAGDLKLEASVSFEPPDAPAASGGLMGAAINVGEAYRQLADDISKGTWNSLGFTHAARSSRLIQTVMRAASTGTRQSFTGLQR